MRMSNKMDAKCFICRKKIKDREEYTSINKGVYSEEGDNDWVALIFHENCWTKFGKGVDRELIPLFETEA